MLFGDIDYCYIVRIDYLSADKPMQSLDFHTEEAARAEAKAIAEYLDDSGILYDIDVYYVDVDHKAWLTGWCNVADEE